MTDQKERIHHSHFLTVLFQFDQKLPRHELCLLEVAFDHSFVARGGGRFLLDDEFCRYVNRWDVPSGRHWTRPKLRKISFGA